MATRRRVVHILGRLYPSGMERMLVSAAPYWQDTGWQAEVIGQGTDHPYAPDLLSAGYPVNYVRSLRTPAGLGDLARLLRTSRPDVVHIHTEQAHGPISFVARVALPTVGLVRTVHSVFRFQGTTIVRRRLQHAMARLTGTLHVAPSWDVAKNEQENWGLTCQVIENWVADEFSRDQQNDGPFQSVEAPLRIAMVGNCSKIKNHQMTLGAAIEVPGVAIVHIGGDSGAPPEERALVRQLEGESRLEMMGARTDVAEILQDSQIFAMPSLHEGMPVALAEALCIGLPCIISDAPGLQWAARDPGVLVARSTNDWISVLARLSVDDSFMSSMTSAAHTDRIRQRERFSACRGVAEYAAIYAQAAQRRP